LSLADFSRIGIGVAIVFTIALYGILLARPSLPVLLLVVASCQAAVFIVMRQIPKSVQAGISLSIFDWELTRTLAFCTFSALLAGWTFYGRRYFISCLPAAGAVAMNFIYIYELTRLAEPDSLWQIMLVPSVPLLLFLQPMAKYLIRYRKYLSDRATIAHIN